MSMVNADLAPPNLPSNTSSLIARAGQWLVVLPDALLSSLQSLLLLGTRLYVSWQFLASGYLKITTWDNTLFLFENEYHTPLLPPMLAAIVGTTGELVFPTLLIVGLTSRLSALGLFAVNAMAVISYANVLLSEGFEAALGQHVLWGFMIAIIAIFGPGRLSLDALVTRYFASAR